MGMEILFFRSNRFQKPVTSKKKIAMDSRNKETKKAQAIRFKKK